MNRNALLLSALFSFALVGCASSGGYGYAGGSHYSRCVNCGVVEDIELVAHGSGRTSGGGAVLGAIVGGVIGNQVGSGSGRKAATAAGAIAGGIAGNKIERERNQRDLYAVFVRMDDGRRLVFEQHQRGGLYEGARVQIRNGVAYRL
ncbi:glycine zipper 2TM domain-containing protein [Pseudomarimonas arenosa]|uniref:Glycine zipper 2TM domain-containing protein n=1 Tax=Pseudomarimonas arenosa TaxID=2774145 RepID=A0AAW3ZKJ4_9GAMM|nr:glycine zipper 2TM domain-containing protein [Pseudomarimonas arenosa]MBD8525217.1 glycine zipper 2TM domain-containing protein [Pseudomarimonas arenosa]